MGAVFIGFGTVVNVVTVLVGSALGIALGHRLSERTRVTVTDVLGLATVVIGGMSVVSVGSAALAAAVGGQASFLVVLFSLLVGALLGSWWRLEERLDDLAGWLTARLVGRRADDAANPSDVAATRHRFATGFVTATLVFCVGPLTILGSLSDGLGRGSQQLVVKAILDGFAAIAFAASLGAGVALSALAVLVIQGSLTLLGFLLGDFLPAAHIDALTATGGMILMGLGIRLLDLKQIRVGDMLPALIVAPLLVQTIMWVR